MTRDMTVGRKQRQGPGKGGAGGQIQERSEKTAASVSGCWEV